MKSSDCKPTRKLVTMVGDGYQRCPGFCAGRHRDCCRHGSDVAIETSDITLTLRSVVTAIAFFKTVIRPVKQHRLPAFVYNVIGISAAAGSLYALMSRRLSPFNVSAAMSLSERPGPGEKSAAELRGENSVMN